MSPLDDTAGRCLALTVGLDPATARDQRPGRETRQGGGGRCWSAACLSGELRAVSVPAVTIDRLWTMSPCWSGSVGPHGCQARPEPGRDAPRGGSATERGRSGRMDSASLAPSSTESPQSLHRWCTVSTSCPHDVPVVHMMWRPSPPGAPLRCSTVSQTPMYDQLRGECINADVPAGEVDPYPLHHPGKHRLRDDAPGPVEVCPSSPGPEADLAEGWSWFGTGELGRADLANVTRPAHSSSGASGYGYPPAADQQSGSDQRGAVERGPLPSPVHARGRQQHGASAFAGTGELACSNR